MSDDFSEFIGEFLGEANEGLERAEQSLLAFDPENPDTDLIHTIFRAVHSIKGAAKMFGFEELVEFTHRVETELDKWRSGELQADADAIALFLECIDAIREQLDAIAQKQSIDTSKGRWLMERLDTLSGSSPGKEGAASTADAHVQPEKPRQVMHITFKPEEGLMRRGQDPLRLLES